MRAWCDGIRKYVSIVAFAGLAAPAYAGGDGVIEINQASALAGGVTPGDTPGFPITIDATFTVSNPAPPTSFRLTGNLSVSQFLNGNAIDVVAPNVTIDLNGFTISCFIGSCSANGIGSLQDNVAVVNGVVRGMNNGVSLTGKGVRVERVRAFDNQVDGILVGNDCLIAGNIANGNTSDGIRTAIGCTISGNTANDNGNDGICTLGGCNVTGNTVSGNTVKGLFLSGTTGYSNNVINGNGITVQSGVPTGLNLCNGSTTCP